MPWCTRVSSLSAAALNDSCEGLRASALCNCHKGAQTLVVTVEKPGTFLSVAYNICRGCQYSGKRNVHTYVNFLKRRLTTGQPAGWPEEKAPFPWFRRKHKNFFVRLTGLRSPGHPDPDQSRKFMFMCLFLFLNMSNVTTVYNTSQVFGPMC